MNFIKLIGCLLSFSLISCNTTPTNTDSSTQGQSNKENTVQENLPKANFSKKDRSESLTKLIEELANNGVGTKLKEIKTGEFYFGLFAIRNLSVQYVGFLSKADASNESIQKISTIPFVNKNMPLATQEGYKNMLFINKDFVTWAFKTLLPEPDEQIGSMTAQQAYDLYGKNFTRLLIEAYLILQKNEESRVIEKYKDMVKKDAQSESIPEPGKDGGPDWTYEVTSWLVASFLQAMPDLNAEDNKDGYCWNCGAAVGFWCRRVLDGSAPSIWKGLEEKIKIYDGEWFQKIQQKDYPYIKEEMLELTSEAMWFIKG